MSVAEVVPANPPLSEARSDRAVVLGYGAMALSGAAALAHELLWTRRLVDLLGSSTSTATRVLAAFFLGLSLGAVVAAWVVPGIRRPMRALAAVEVAIALLSLPVLTLSDWTGGLWSWVGVESLGTASANQVKLALAMLVMLPPAAAMGFTMPLAARGIGDLGAGGHSVRLYAINTLGGALGLLGVSLWALSLFGVSGSLGLCMVGNLAAAGLAVLADRALEGEATERVEAREDLGAAEFRPPWWALALSALSGAGILAVEVVALQSLMLVATMSYLAPASLLCTVVLVLALCSWLVGALRHRVTFEAGAPLAAAAGGLLLAVAPLVYWWLVEGGAWLSGTSVASVAGRIAAMALLFVGPGLLFVGALFPLLIARPRGQSARSVAWLLAFNGVGGLVGAEAAHRWLLPSVGPHVAMGAIGAAYGLVGLCLAAWQLRTRRPRFGLAVAMGAALSLAGAVVLSRGPLPQLPTLNAHAGFQLVEETRGREGVLAVVDHPRTGRSLILNNQYVLGGTAARFDQERQTHLPLLMHPEPRTVGFIGLATGSTAGAALLHPSVHRVEVAELSGLVIDAAREHFAPVNRKLVDDPRVRVLEEDGRAFVLASPGRFDVLVGDLFLPWSPGVGRLYSVEHFQAARRALRPGGIFCQWLPAHQLTESQLQVIVNSLLEAFGSAHLFRNTFRVEAPALGLCAGDGLRAPWDVLRRRTRQVRGQRRVRDPSMRHFEAAAMLYVGPATATANGGLNTLGNVRLELVAGQVRAVQGVDAPYLRKQRWNDYLRARVGLLARDSTLPPAAVASAKAGFLLTNWGIARRIGDRRAGELALRVREALPAKVYQDAQADWQQWPGPAQWRIP